MIHSRFMFAVFMLFASSGQSIAATIKGVIISSGDPGKRWTTITKSPNESPAKICAGGREREIVQLPGAVVEITGSEKTAQGKTPACFYAESYVIDEIAPGRPAITGVLTKIDKTTYAIINHSGKKWILAKIPPGMKDFQNQDVVCDLVANATSNGQTTWVVARAFPLPTAD